VKEFIEVLDKNGKTKTAEVELRFHDEKKNLFYIVYKVENEYFAAKYDDIVGTSKLDTNLDDKELEMLEKQLNSIEEK
jgi:hypothetical protein